MEHTFFFARVGLKKLWHVRSHNILLIQDKELNPPRSCMYVIGKWPHLALQLPVSP